MMWWLVSVSSFLDTWEFLSTATVAVACYALIRVTKRFNHGDIQRLNEGDEGKTNASTSIDNSDNDEQDLREYYNGIMSWKVLLANLVTSTSARKVLHRVDNGFAGFVLERLLQLCAPSNVLMGFLKEYPHAAQGSNQWNASATLLGRRSSSNSSWFPIHYACRYNNYRGSSESLVDVITELLRLHPEGASKFAFTPGSGRSLGGQRNNGDLPLHIICRSRRRYWRLSDMIEIIRILLHVYPKGAQQFNGCGFLPLHLLLYFENPSHECVDLLVEAYPNAVKQYDSCDRLPIHYACLYESNPNINILQTLVQHYPQSLHITKTDLFPLMFKKQSMTENVGFIPLEIILTMQSKNVYVGDKKKRDMVHDVIEFFVLQTYSSPYYRAPTTKVQQNNDTELREKNDKGLVVHQALVGGASLSVIEQILTLFPEDLSTPDDAYGRLPLHWAFILPRQNDEVVKIANYLFQEHPLAADVEDCYGLLPFHYCALQLQNHKSAQCDKSLGFPTPHTVFCKFLDTFINKSYLDLGLRRSCMDRHKANGKKKNIPSSNQSDDMELLFLMLRWNPTAVLNRGGVVLSNLHTEAMRLPPNVKKRQDASHTALEKCDGRINDRSTIRTRKDIEIALFVAAGAAVSYYLLNSSSSLLYYFCTIGNKWITSSKRQ